MAIFMEFHQVPVNAECYPGHIRKTVQWVQDILLPRYDDRLNISLGHSTNNALPHCLDIRNMNARNIVIGFTAHGFLTGWGVYDGSCVEKYNPLTAYLNGINVKQGNLEVCFQFVNSELNRWVEAGTIGLRNIR